MDSVQLVLTLATLASFAADVYAIINDKKWQGVALLFLAAALAIALGLEARHAAKIETENTLLTNTQVRAERLIQSWNNEGDRLFPYLNLTGTNEGIVAATADLMEDTRACRPGAAEEARHRLADAHARSEALGEGLQADHDRKQIWEDAAGAAYEQVAAVSRVAPNC